MNEPMIELEPGESRLHYLLRVATEFARKHGWSTIRYDGTTCDGYCLADELESEAAKLLERGG